MVIRPYDLSGRIALRLDIVDADGKIIDTPVNH